MGRPWHIGLVLVLAAVAFGGCGGEVRVQSVGQAGAAFFRFGQEGVGELGALDKGWQVVRLGEGWCAQGLKGSHRVGRAGWYRWDISLPEDPVEAGLMLSAGFVGNNSELYLNGKRVGGLGSFQQWDSARPRLVHAFPVMPSFLRWGEVNTVLVRVRGAAGDGGLLGGPVGLFPADALMREIRRLEGHRDWMKLSVVAVCLGLACDGGTAARVDLVCDAKVVSPVGVFPRSTGIGGLLGGVGVPVPSPGAGSSRAVGVSVLCPDSGDGMPVAHRSCRANWGGHGSSFGLGLWGDGRGGHRSVVAPGPALVAHGRAVVGTPGLGSAAACGRAGSGAGSGGRSVQASGEVAFRAFAAGGGGGAGSNRAASS